MNCLSFAYRAVVHVYMQDYHNPPRLVHELLEDQLMTASFQYDGDGERDLLLEGVDFDREGYFTVWMVGKFVWSYDGWTGEHDLDIEPDVLVVEEAREGDMERITGMQCFHKLQPDIPADTPPGCFKFT